MKLLQSNSFAKKSGFTLIELLTTIAIIGVLIGILLPATQAVRASVRRTACSNNLRQVMLSMLDYEVVNNHFPTADNGKGGSLFVELLPHLDQKVLYQRSISDLEPGETYEDRLADISRFPLEILFCPASDAEIRTTNVDGQGEFTTHYYGITGPIGTAVSSDGNSQYSFAALTPEPPGGSVGLDGMFAPDANGQFSFERGSKDALDGAACTLTFGEISRFSLNSAGAPVSRGGWSFGAVFQTTSAREDDEVLDQIYSAKSIEFPLNSAKGKTNNVSFASSHTGGSQFAFADGSVRFISDRLSLDILKTLASTNGSEQPEQLDQ